MKSQLHKNTMCRIWYAYTLMQVKYQLISRAFWQGMVFGVSLLVFAHNVHVASVLQNTLDTPLGRVPEFLLYAVLNAIQNGDLVKVVTLLLLVSITVSILRKIASVQINHQFLDSSLGRT